jgi:hypothetical protein
VRTIVRTAKPQQQPDPLPQRLRRFVASPTSTALAYTVLCMVTLLFALCIDKMPQIAVERFVQLRELFS